jgi:hypothetical protein
MKRHRLAVAAALALAVVVCVPSCSDDEPEGLSAGDRRALADRCDEVQAELDIADGRTTCEDIVERVVRLADRAQCSLDEALTLMDSEAALSLDGPEVYESLPCVRDGN